MKNDINSFFRYYPKHSDSFDFHSKLILNLKDNHPHAVDYFYKVLSKFFARSVGYGDVATLCCVPTSRTDYLNPIAYIIRRLCDSNSSLADGSLLIRTIMNRNSFCRSRVRDAAELYLSIYIFQDVKDLDIVLIDDVCCTGLSLLTIKNMLLNRGARSVECLALAKS
jgi:predicted amidophosphoribosyltransferase